MKPPAESGPRPETDRQPPEGQPAPAASSGAAPQEPRIWMTGGKDRPLTDIEVDAYLEAYKPDPDAAAKVERIKQRLQELQRQADAITCTLPSARGGALREGEMGQREGSLKCVNCGAANFYECGCYARCRCGHDRRLHMATGTCTVVGCECEHGFHDSAGRPPADTIERLTRERDEARAQLDRVRKLVEKWRAEVIEYPAVSSWGANVAQSAVTLCADELEQELKAS